MWVNPNPVPGPGPNPNPDPDPDPDLDPDPDPNPKPNPDVQLPTLRRRVALAERGETSWTQIYYSCVWGHGIAGGEVRAEAVIRTVFLEMKVG